MDIKYAVRKAQLWKGSYIVTIPIQMGRELEIEKDQYLKFALADKMLVIKRANDKILKKDMVAAAKMVDGVGGQEGVSEDDGSDISELNESSGPPRKRRAAKGNLLESLKM